MRVFQIAIVGVVLLGTGGGRLSGGQSFQQPGQQPGAPTFPGVVRPPGDDHALSPIIAERQEQVRNTDRQKKLESDTDKLLTLATQLKEDVQKTNKNVLSVDVIKKADEIEKLAHSVKERMKG
jgi:hypothetical protein